VPTPFDHALVAVLAVLFPLRAARAAVRRLRLAPAAEQPRMRLRVYAEAIALQWAFVLAVVALWVALGRPWEALGLVVRPDARFLGVAALVLGLVLGGVLQVRRAVLEPGALERTLERVRHLEALLPHGPHELAGFRRLAITAGVCEEVLYRGYLLWYLGAWMDPWAAVGVASAVFGIGHAYQGWRGILSTAAVGLLLCALYVVSGSLLPAMVAHAAVDLHAGHLTHAAFAWRARRDAERALDEARVLEQMRSEAARGSAAATASTSPVDAPAPPAAAGGA
jgi:membrane protease YdiL (CAAX protease family)